MVDIQGKTWSSVPGRVHGCPQHEHMPMEKIDVVHARLWNRVLLALLVYALLVYALLGCSVQRSKSSLLRALVAVDSPLSCPFRNPRLVALP